MGALPEATLFSLHEGLLFGLRVIVPKKMQEAMNQEEFDLFMEAPLELLGAHTKLCGDACSVCLCGE